MQIVYLTKTGFAAATALALFASPVLAVPTMRPANVVNLHTGQPVATVVVPDVAVDSSDAIVSLGFARDPSSGREVQGFAIIHYKNGYARSGGAAKDLSASCYGFLAKGARWKAAESYALQGHWEFVSDATASGTWTYVYDFNTSAVARDLETWDSQVAFNVFAEQDTTPEVVNGADTVAPDGHNEMMWGDVSSPGAIAVTIVWGIFYGPPSGRELVEWDMVFDNVDFPNWGDATVDFSVMDFENIAIHELGHSAGLADLYTGQCSEQTMYGYASYGETKKRDLGVGDINGIKALYK
ncbi:MAG: hypothetical protein A2667_02225 [Candidatus Wildermuthbacteria bacterium RIFCSPHIGHO2_01_FULL_47_27]|uniref:Peptidase M10 metallopeptidase domain-containing protein n=2 Tax=Candidatus Wildermuthiibacteriota TaxID=1817923 RepID=A0A1G2RMA8_9BACT|nr:MAG: Peptidase M10A and M12B matrixin and adamalysin [Parcubacteria group bacterium GW2011_GWA2_47_9]OHA63505.1 MAG: hypothetical protein A2667_02225 [Candidatus Wildermuthbacteria bacterium RIFCSPHIGHO2_01_FULL_47_27]OHA67713.1 MAG: hypothetical protein A3D59_04750 [Candidatus Wildermuthbacteria bacterium RIFCSPHIGHO2_02_FULL_47_17]OHA73993.1 MAG: hypothetical protein A3A32_01125 [Candidatus Wildermuthbacteria bacterium RIFCSPLOWO2_01_FULL_48_35]OHA75594.1 MAG: hypothetical protein A3I38_03